MYKQVTGLVVLAQHHVGVNSSLSTVYWALLVFCFEYAFYVDKIKEQSTFVNVLLLALNFGAVLI